MGIFSKKKNDINDDDIVKIPLENLDINLEDIEVIDGFYDSKSNKLKTYTIPVISLVVIALLIFTVIYTLFNFRFVEGDVIGKELQIGPFSIVSTQYDSSDYVQQGKEIYYNGTNTDFPITMKGQYDIAVVTKVNESRVFVPGTGKDVVVGMEDVNYVIASGESTEKAQQEQSQNQDSGQ